MAAKRRPICLQLTEGNPVHDAIWDYLKTVPKQQTIIDAILLYIDIGGKPRNDPPPTPGPQAPLDPEGIQPILEGLEAICEEVRAIGPAIGLSVAAALQGSGFSVNQTKGKKAAKPAKPKAPIYGAKAIEPPPGLLDSIADGMADWAVAQGG